MAKANITTQDGVSVAIEGTPKEVAELVAQLRNQAQVSPARRHSKTRADEKHKATPINLVAELIDGGFFKKPKELGAIKTALEEQGHYYPVTTLSPTMLRLVRRKQIRRIRDKKRWLYVGH